MTERINWYRANAEKCLSLAQRFRDPESKRALVAMANAWLAMAEQRAQNNKVQAGIAPQPDRVEPDGS